MAHTWICLLLSLIGQSWSQEFTCESASPGVCVEDLYPYPYDCNKFWQCTTTCQSYLMDCPEFLHFSAENKTCLSQVDAMCEETTTVAPSTTTLELTQSTTQPSTTPTTTTQSTTVVTGDPTSPVPANPSMFFVGKSESYTGNPAAVDFDVTVTDRRGDFDLTTNQFVAPTTGIYFFAMSCGLQPGGNIIYRLEDPNQLSVANIRRTSDAHITPDMISRDIIIPLSEGDIRFMNLTSTDGLFSNSQLQTSLAGFSIHDAMTLVSAFSVAINTQTNALGVVDFNVVLTNENGDFDTTNNAYRAPVDGIYVFSVSAGVISGETTRVRLLVNSVNGYELWREHSEHDGDDTLSRSMLLSLNAGDLVQYELVSGWLQSNDRHQTSFSGFYYNPRFLIDPVAWFVSHTRGWVSTVGSVLSPVDYDAVVLNVRNPFNNSTYEVTIPESGFYYIHFGTGAEREFQIRERNVDLTLMKRSIEGGITTLVDLVRDATDFIGVDTVSRGAIYELNTGDVLYMTAASGTAFYGDNFRALSYFMGLMFYSTE